MEEQGPRILELAVEYGNLSTLQYLQKVYNIHLTSSILNTAARNGSVEIIQYLLNIGCPISIRALDYAAQNGHLDAVKLLHQNKLVKCSTAAIDWAAENGHLQVVKFLYENRKEGCTTYAIDRAASNGHTSVVEYLLAANEEFSWLALEMAVQNDHKEVARLLVKRDEQLLNFALQLCLSHQRKLMHDYLEASFAMEVKQRPSKVFCTKTVLILIILITVFALFLANYIKLMMI